MRCRSILLSSGVVVATALSLGPASTALARPIGGDGRTAVQLVAATVERSIPHAAPTPTPPPPSPSSPTAPAPDGTAPVGPVADGGGTVAGGKLPSGTLGKLGGLVDAASRPTVVAPPRGPAVPGLRALEPTAYAVTVRWYDRTNNTPAPSSFTVYKRGNDGNRTAVFTTPVHAGSTDYSWVDTDRSVSGQCYWVVASTADASSSSAETCTVRPDPNRFPQTTPAGAQDWYGLDRRNDVAAPLFSIGANQYLKQGHETWGVNLVWGADGNNVKAERLGGGNDPAPLMKGEAVAIRVWGGGWLKHGNQTWGVDLQLSDTPSYEWYVVGGTPGQPLDQGRFALWNSDAHDYLVHGGETFGIDLDWYQHTVSTPPPPTTSPSPGVKTFVVYNCTTEQRPLEMWVKDLSAGGAWVDEGRLEQQYADGGCPATGQPFTYSPPSGHEVLVEAVDLTAPGCSNDPDVGSCWRSLTTLVGDSNGQVVSTTIS